MRSDLAAPSRQFVVVRGQAFALLQKQVLSVQQDTVQLPRMVLLDLIVHDPCNLGGLGRIGR
jgi:hypothetical protein